MARDDELGVDDALLPDEHRWLINRRKFVIGAGMMAGAAVVDGITQALAINVAAENTPLSTSLPLGFTGLKGWTFYGSSSTFSYMLRRREDFLCIQLDGYNVALSNGQLKPGSGGGYLVFTFPPQHVVEEAYFQSSEAGGDGFAGPVFSPNIGGNQIPDPPGQTAARLAGPTRLAFKLPSGGVAFTLPALLAWSNLTPSLTPMGANQMTGGLNWVNPMLDTKGVPSTSIELPWHLALTPRSSGTWSHPTALNLEGSPNGFRRSELWHTSLGTYSAAGTGGPVRAVWNFDVGADPNAYPYTPKAQPALAPPSGSLASNGPQKDVGNFKEVQPLYVWNRHEIVRNTSAYGPHYVDAQANRLWLSARGGFLDAVGSWTPPVTYGSEPDDLIGWQHRTTQGRDQYVKIVEQGYLWPFGHRAAKIVISERVFQARGQVDPDIIATLRQITFIVIRDPMVYYASGPHTFFADTNTGIATDGRDFPFRSLQCLTERTPDLDLPTPPAGATGDYFFPISNGQPVNFHFLGLDWIGRQISFSVPALYVAAGNPANTISSAGRHLYNQQPASMRTADFHGQTVAFAAPANTATPGDTDMHVTSMTFACGNPPYTDLSTHALDSHFYSNHDLPWVSPTLATSVSGVATNAQALVRLSQHEALSGGGALPGGGGSQAFGYHPDYVTHGFGSSPSDPNKVNVFMQAATGAGVSTLVYGNGSSGGLLTPNVPIGGLSRSLGPIGDPGSLADPNSLFGGTFNPDSFFGGALSEAKFLGGLPLSALLNAFNVVTQGAPPFSGTIGPDNPSSNIPQISYSVAGTTATTTVKWVPPFSSAPNTSSPSPSVTNHWFTPLSGFGVTLDGTITTDLTDPTKTKSSFTGELDNFMFSLMMKDNDAVHFIDISFAKLLITAGSGQKTHLTPHGINVKFAGPLEFINQLQELMKLDDSLGGVKIFVDGNGIHVDTSLNLPDTPGAFFMIKGLSFHGNLDIPLDGSSMAVFSFGLASAENPFTIAGGIFAGGGYFLVQIGTAGVRQIVVSVFFGAMIALNIVVASGQVSLTATITFTYGALSNADGTPLIDPQTKQQAQGCSLVMTVKLEGSLNILDIIQLSLVFDLTLRWVDDGTNTVTGSATIQISISIAFFTLSTSATASKTFAGGSGGQTTQIRGHVLPAGVSGPVPTGSFQAQVGPGDWKIYCAAFA